MGQIATSLSVPDRKFKSSTHTSDVVESSTSPKTRSERPRSGSIRDPAKFHLKPVPPFSLELTVWALRRRPSNLIDLWDGQTYRRVLMLNDKPVQILVTQKGTSEKARLQVELIGRNINVDEKHLAIRALERVLGLRVDLREFYKIAARDSKLNSLAVCFRGLKPPRFPGVFEALANAIACQQLSLTLGILLLGRITTHFGMPVQMEGDVAHAFPRPEDLAGLHPTDFRELGFSIQKGRALIALSRACLENKIDLEQLENLNNVSAIQHLLELRGIGRWSAEYTLLRGLGRLDVYPGDDVGARNNLQRWLNLPKPLDYESVGRITAKWQPYAGFVYFHMLLERLAAAGTIPISSVRAA